MIIDNLDRWVFFPSSGRGVYHYSAQAKINRHYKASGGAGLEGSSPKAVWDNRNRQLQVEYHLLVPGEPMCYECKVEYADELQGKIKKWLKSKGAGKYDIIVIVEPMKRPGLKGGNKYEVQIYWKLPECPTDEFMKEMEGMLNEKLDGYEGCEPEEEEEEEEEIEKPAPKEYDRNIPYWQRINKKS